MQNSCQETQWFELSKVQQEQLKLKNDQLKASESLVDYLGRKLDNYKGAVLILATMVIILLMYK